MAPRFPTNVNYNKMVCEDKISDMTLIWFDKNITKNDENYYSMSQFCNIIQNILTFSDINLFEIYLRDRQNKQKVILVISGSLGQQFIPKIHSCYLLDSIFIFCQNKTKHQQWAKDFHKIEGVFDNIDRLCLRLRQSKLDKSNSNKQKSSFDKLTPLRYIERLIDSDQRMERIRDEFMSYYNEKNALPVEDMEVGKCFDDENENMDSILMFFSSNSNIEKSTLVEHSHTVVPFVQQTNQYYLDNGIWPSLWWIKDSENNLSKMLTFNKLQHLIVKTNIIDNVNIYLKKLNNDLNEEHFLVLCDFNNLGDSLTSITRFQNVQRIYLYCSLDILKQYKTIIERFSKLISILQHSDSLIQMVLHDSTFYAIKLAQNYKRQNENHLAENRYRYALHLQSNTQDLIKQRLKQLDEQ